MSALSGEACAASRCRMALRFSDLRLLKWMGVWGPGPQWVQGKALLLHEAFRKPVKPLKVFQQCGHAVQRDHHRPV